MTSPLVQRFGRAVQELFADGQDAHRKLEELANDPTARRYISNLLDRFQKGFIGEALDEAANTGSSPIDAMTIGQERASAALFRLAFELGRLDERHEARSLNDLLNGLEG